jgi:hypothetical protein
MKNGMFTTYQLVIRISQPQVEHISCALRKAASFTRTPRVCFHNLYGIHMDPQYTVSNSLINHLVGYTRYTPTIPTINHKFGICCLRTQHCLARHGIPWCLKWSNFKLIFSKPCPFFGRATTSSCRANKRNPAGVLQFLMPGPYTAIAEGFGWGFQK